MKAKKSLGQNFLIDNNVINHIVSEVNVKDNDLIIEIGPGTGALTKLLIQKNANLIAYEIDNDLIPKLKKLENEKTKIIHQDILKADIKSDINNINFDKLIILGNLPYYITTPIIKYLISSHLDIDSMIFMVQEEVADRFSASPKTKNYGSITLFLKFYYDVEKLFVVNKNSFDPIPKVESAVIRFTKRNAIPKVNEEKYFNLINDAFSQKRKTLKNNLKNYDFESIMKILENHGFNEQVRAEEISEDIFVEIANTL